ncbi:Anthranilate synthase alpha subunit 1 protein [Thalictrum thalictroides]|uniref:Anthranilate synthase alpha subunit 1 protein n=1 Tax=Thalictrum thalictroides TaxID=46969 RepID=A0A7J6VCP8_THATH|nr:Anthranilate synthase alpha subunit 1 protein [Thalictrum thalictroides]
MRPDAGVKVHDVADISANDGDGVGGDLVNDQDTFTNVSKKCNLIPLYRCIFSDQLTPVLAYRCLVKEEDRESPSFLFDSFGQGYQASNVGRYSAVGHEPVMEILAKENRVTIIDHDEGLKREEFVDDPMKIPERIMKGWIPMQVHELPDFFCGK